MLGTTNRISINGFDSRKISPKIWAVTPTSDNPNEHGFIALTDGMSLAHDCFYIKEPNRSCTGRYYKFNNECFEEQQRYPCLWRNCEPFWVRPEEVSNIDVEFINSPYGTQKSFAYQIIGTSDWNSFALNPSDSFTINVPESGMRFIRVDWNGFNPDESHYGLNIHSDEPFEVGGDIRSILCFNDFDANPYAYKSNTEDLSAAYLFANNPFLLDSRHLELPMNNCIYDSMFAGCSRLRSSPMEIAILYPDDGLSSFNSMFSGCELMETAPIVYIIHPEMGSNVSDSNMYYGMFHGCFGLGSIYFKSGHGTINADQLFAVQDGVSIPSGVTLYTTEAGAMGLINTYNIISGINIEAYSLNLIQ